MHPKLILKEIFRKIVVYPIIIFFVDRKFTLSAKEPSEYSPATTRPMI